MVPTEFAVDQLIMGVAVEVQPNGNLGYTVDMALHKEGDSWSILPFVSIGDDFEFRNELYIDLGQFINHYEDRLENLVSIQTDPLYSVTEQTYLYCKDIKNNALLHIVDISDIDNLEDVYLVRFHVVPENETDGIQSYAVMNGKIKEDISITENTYMNTLVQSLRAFPDVLAGNGDKVYYEELEGVKEYIRNQEAQIELRMKVLGVLTARAWLTNY